MWAIIKKEVRTYFLSPIGYVFVGLFLLMASLFFYSEVLVTGSTMFSNIFYSLSTNAAPNHYNPTPIENEYFLLMYYQITYYI